MATNDKQFNGLQVAREQSGRPAAVVGIGVCRESFRSLEKLFTELEPDLSAAYLIAVRQEEGLTVGPVVEMLERCTAFPVKIAADHEPMRANHIYVGGPEDMIAIEDGHVHTRPAAEPIGHRGTIDSMLISIAEHAHQRAVAVLLSGIGNDGSAGVTATKKHGGLSVAEAPGWERESDDQGEGRQLSASAGIADLLVPIEAMPGKIADYIDGLTPFGRLGEREEVPEEVAAQVTQIATILRNVTGHDFHGYKRKTFVRRIQRRMQVLQIEEAEDYIARLRDDRDEAHHLFQDLLIGVTQFFRDPQEFEVLEREIPRLFEGKGPDDQFRVWVLGCATGEEAYSLGILLREHMATLDRPPHVQIFATDLDARALGLARVGRYASSIAEHIRPDRLARWFVKEGDTYCVSKELREMCIFSPHNVVRDAPFSRIDLLSCRNLLIYLNADLQDRVIPIFHFALRSGGVLFLGSSENVTRHQRLFAPVDRKNRVFRRLDTATRVLPQFPLSPRSREPETVRTPQPGGPPAAGLTPGISRQADAIAQRYAPAYVVIDDRGDVLHFSGRTSRYLEPTGAATLNILNLAHRDLRLDLRSALHRAIAERQRVETARVLLRHDDRTFAVNIAVEPLGDGDVTALVVVFQDAGSAIDTGLLDGERVISDEHVQRLEAELRLTRDRLQATIEELESTNEELKSSNEEYQSINEELQSANEEMETSKEELQSINEELQTVNGELAHRVGELGRSNSDLKNLLEATQIATVFLDNELRVRNFTPAATEIFHVIETDTGRPLDHIVSRVSYPELKEDVRRVLKTLIPIEREVTDPTADRRFAVRVLPYRSLDNYISGAVVTFTDLTATYKAEAALRESEKRFRQFGEASQDVLWLRDSETLAWEYLSSAFETVYGVSREEALAGDSFRSWTELILHDDREYVLDQIERVRTGEHVVYDYRIRRASDGAIRWLRETDFAVQDESGRVIRIGGIGHDATDLREIEQRLQTLMEGIPQLVWRAGDAGSWTWASPQWTGYTGQSEPESRGWGWLEVIAPEDRDTARAAWSRAESENGFDVEYRIHRASDGTHRWFRTRATPVRDEEGRITEWLGTSTDIHDLRELQARQEVLVAELQHRTRNLMGLVRSTTNKTLRSSSDLDDFGAKISDRLGALARVQGLLSRLEEHDRITFDELIRAEISALDGGAADGRVVLDGPAGVPLRSSTVQTLAMALHELATNAVKYGALHQPNGQLAIRWRLEPKDGEARPWLHVEWRESGVDMPPGDATPHGSGQGRELIERALPYQLGARTSFVMGEDGVQCTIALPVSNHVVE